MPVLQLDRIYVRGFEISNATVLHGASWARLSDHAPIVAELTLLPVQAKPVVTPARTEPADGQLQPQQ